MNRYYIEVCDQAIDRLSQGLFCMITLQVFEHKGLPDNHRGHVIPRDDGLKTEPCLALTANPAPFLGF